MKARFLFALLLTLLAGPAAYASGLQPVVSFTFTCKTTGFQGQRLCASGGRPDSLIQASDGNFYGAAQDSMEGTSTPDGGSVFSVTPAGKFTLLHTFPAGPSKKYPNGNLPGLLTEAADGKLYGYTLFGGVGGCNGYCGSGVLYRVNKDGSGFRILHKFCSASNCTDGGFGILVTGKDGNLYGTSTVGGNGSSCGPFYQGCGTIFRVTPASAAYDVIVDFDFKTNGAFPSVMTLASDGTFYGVSSGTAGTNLFHFSPSVGTISNAALNFPTFNGLPSRPATGLTIGTNGNFYGLYSVYGKSGDGLFEANIDGSNLQLFSFYTTQLGGGSPDGLLLASDGNFWVADYNGTSGYGDIVTLSPADGSLIRRINPFSASASVGAYPAEIIQAKNGTLWGSTYQGGRAVKGFFGDGTVFNLNVGLPPR